MKPDDNEQSPHLPAAELEDDYCDSTDHIAYQYSNLIQPHVLFLNVDRCTQCILNASTNTEPWLGKHVHDVIGATLDDELLPGVSDFLSQVQRERLVNSPACFDRAVQSCDGTPLLCRIHATEDRFSVELELLNHPLDDNPSERELQRLMMLAVSSLNNAKTIEDVVGRTLTELRSVLGFERGMGYRFDEDNNGEVIAECLKNSSDQKYIGLRFPSRDIPRSARQMLLTTRLRVTMDQRLDCHPIYPSKDPVSSQFVDLTHVRGRGAAGSCREYYLNMNVRSTLVLPLIVANRLWGMLSFHDSKPKRVSPRLDPYLEAITNCVSFSLDRITQSAHVEADSKGRDVVRTLSEFDSSSDAWLRHLQSNAKNLKELLPCDGFLLRIAGEIIHFGSVPEDEKRQTLLDTLCELADGNQLSTHWLASLDPQLEGLSSVAAGTIAVPLMSEPNDIAIWLRPDQTQNVRWAGDPNSDIEHVEGKTKRLCPRASFQEWTVVTNNTCAPWTANDLTIAKASSMQLGLLTLSWYASQASRAKTQFLSCMSHEIRTPMNAILGYTDLLQEHRASIETDAQANDFIEIIRRNGQHLLVIIDDILDLAKIESGKLTTERIPVHLVPMIQDVASIVSIKALSKQLAFHIEFPTPVPKVIHSDQVRLRQILINLLGNAIKFTEAGAVTLRVGMATENQIYFEVIDTGIGLTEEQQGRLFNAFIQADATTTRRFGGSGLGLQISKNLAELLGGNITIQSQLGIGSTFRFTTATGSLTNTEYIDAISPAQISQVAAAPQPTLKHPPISLSGLRILVMEDGPDNQKLIAFLLERAGAKVTLFDNGRVGIEAMTVDGGIDSPLDPEAPYDLILTDMQMPELDGYSATRLLREKGCQLPIIALTAFAMLGDVDNCLSAGCNDYLPKPINKQDLFTICEKWGETARSVCS